MEFEQLKLRNQLCFPIYAASRLITRTYQPLLDELKITYPQYLVLMVLWEHDSMPVNTIAKKLILNTNTITPLLKRMETQGIVKRTRSNTDERKVTVSLTDKGRQLRMQAADIPEKLVAQLDTDKFSIDELIDLREKLNNLINSMIDR
ncbi:MarR family winged helix-turn-helix transcriptional regulator [Draconibacterium halophilum]|uniref:MarR family transcriptional regulator n=1 Tax=Draconibacterium halophilum TaxID=2706887 RepID=A0A6C0RFE5_9BACT|nr:MarR family transcriptional regulator [Draconibacterium halophilum]QIA08869.1 MarR family transcriptional regulator [Draconibacterium halophilum]